MPTAYSRKQVILHWLVFALIAAQFVLHEPIADAWDRVEEGLAFEFHPLIAAHVFGGLLILGLVVWRLYLRITRGAPALPEKEPAAMKLIARVTHLGLYGLMLLMPISGAVAWFGGVNAAAEGHEMMKVLLLVLVGLHVAGALYQQFVLKTNIMARMKRPG